MIPTFSVLYKRESLADEPVAFLDINELSKDGTISLAETSFSDDGSLLAYAIRESGSNWAKIKIHNVDTGEGSRDLLEGIKFPTMAWTHGNKGLFYGVSQL